MQLRLKTRELWCAAVGLLMMAQVALSGTTPLGTAFTYQGHLRQGGTAVNGTIDVQCRLWDALSGPTSTQIGNTICLDGIQVANGVFTVSLDFGVGAFGVDARFLEVGVRIDNTPGNCGAGAYTTLSPRQQLTAAPVAQFALSAHGANISNLNANNITTGTVPSAAIAGSYNNVVSFSNAGNAFTGLHLGSGSGLTSLNASNLASGNVSASRLPTGGSWSLLSNLNLDAGTLFVDAINNRVGIGNASPQATLHVGAAYNPTFTAIARFGDSIAVNGSIGSDQGAILSRSPQGSGAATVMVDSENDTGGSVWFMNSNANNSPFGSPGGTWTLYNGLDRLTVTSNGRVGIGTNTPLRQFHVASGSAGTISPSANASVVLERSTHNYLHMYTPDVSESGMLFGGDTTDVRGGILFNSTAAEGLAFRTGGNTTRMVLTSAGDVGIGTTAPAARLHVNGAIRIATVTRRINVPAAAFAVVRGATFTSGSAGIGIAGNSLESMIAVAPVFLPDGAVVTFMSGIVHDINNNANQDLRLQLKRKDMNGGNSSPEIMADGSTSGAHPAAQAADNTIDHATIDNANYGYYLEATAPPGAFFYTLYTVRIDYTITTPLP